MKIKFINAVMKYTKDSYFMYRKAVKLNKK